MGAKSSAQPCQLIRQLLECLGDSGSSSIDQSFLILVLFVFCSGCPLHRGVFSNIPRLYSLDVNNKTHKVRWGQNHL